jgi:hypothetical protein
MSDKISISLDEINSPQVDAKIRIDAAMLQTAQHQQQVQQNYKSTPANQGNIFYKAAVYLALFGLGFGFIGWCASEVFMQAREHMIMEIIQGNTDGMDEDEAIATLFGLNILWYAAICIFISIGLSIADSLIERNYSVAVIRGLIALGISIVISPVACIAAELLYNALGGGRLETNFAVQMFARALAWLFIGCFVGMAPGIVMRSWKKFGYGVAGGAVGGLLGGLLFDPISIATQTGVLSRLVGIVGFGVLAGISIGLIEEAAKQGWLKVVAGVITGKQFIIYKNPTVIGSSPKCEIYLFKDTSVMPQHAAIRQQGNSYIIEQVDFRVPLFINGQPVQRHTLRNGDQIGIGKSLFVFGTKEIQNH